VPGGEQDDALDVSLEHEREHEQDHGCDERNLGEASRHTRNASEAEQGRDERDDGEDDEDVEKLSSHKGPRWCVWTSFTPGRASGCPLDPDAGNPPRRNGHDRHPEALSALLARDATIHHDHAHARRGLQWVAVEQDEALANAAESNLASLAIDNAVVLNKPLVEGVPGEGPYDVIVVSGGIATAPTALYDQLAEGGRLIAVWMQNGTGQARLSVKSGDDIATRWIFDATAPILPGFEATPSFAF